MLRGRQTTARASRTINGPAAHSHAHPKVEQIHYLV